MRSEWFGIKFTRKSKVKQRINSLLPWEDIPEVPPCLLLPSAVATVVFEASSISRLGMASGFGNKKESLSSVPRPAWAGPEFIFLPISSGIDSGFVLMILRSFLVAGQGLDTAKAFPAPHTGKVGGDPKEFPDHVTSQIPKALLSAA